MHKHMMAGHTLRAMVIAACALTALIAVNSADAMTLHAIVKDDSGKPVRNAVVYAVPGNDVPAAVSGRPAEAVMDQQDSEFIPYVLPVRVGTSVRFPNKDNIRHHVYSISPAKKFELPLYKGGSAAPVVFDKPGVVVLGCNIHDWMLAYIYVMDTPYFSKTGESGTADLRDLPQGSYIVRVWHPRMKGSPESTDKNVSATPQGELSVDFTIAFQISEKPEWKPLRIPAGEGGRYR